MNNALDMIRNEHLSMSRLLALLEQQSHLLSTATPSADQVGWALGYQGENGKWRGLQAQIRWAVRQIVVAAIMTRRQCAACGVAASERELTAVLRGEWFVPWRLEVRCYQCVTGEIAQ